MLHKFFENINLQMIVTTRSRYRHLQMIVITRNRYKQLEKTNMKFELSPTHKKIRKEQTIGNNHYFNSK